MKFLLFYSVVFVAVLAAISPLNLLASSGLSIDKPVRKEWTNKVSQMFQDSTSARKKSPDKHKEVQKPPQDDRDERLKEAQRREIKQVPRSIPKLKPQPVSEGHPATPLKKVWVDIDSMQSDLSAKDFESSPH